MSGIPLIHWHSQWLEPIASRKINEKPTHIARPVPEDEARDAVVAAALRMGNARNQDEYRKAFADLAIATTKLDALTKGDA